MRSDLPPAIAAAIARCEGPTLLFDRARIVANMRAIASAARAARITPLFAAKSFPHAEVWALAAETFDGFDAASAGEVATLPAARILSIVDPSGRAAQRTVRAERLIVGCETAAQVAAAPARAEIAIRISASITGRDSAVGAVLDGTGHRRSRFGIEDDLAALVRAADGRPVGLHVHHGPITATSVERFLATARAALALADAAGVAPRFLDLGGAWHGIADLPHAFAELRAQIPEAIELIVEPGRAIVDGAGFACGRVLVARGLEDERLLRVVDLSRICHLRWSAVELVGVPPHPGAGRTTLFVGPTCFEEDVVGEWSLEPERSVVDTRVVLRHVSGYAVAWNTGFGGVAPAAVVLA